MAEQAFQAVGALAGRLDGDGLVVITGERFPATVSPVLRQWLEKNPEAAKSVRIWLAYPRTTKVDNGLAFYLVGSPEDQDDPRWQRQLDRFNIKGQVVVSRAGKDNTVVWIPRNEAPPIGKRRHPDWKGRTLFLRRALRPVRRWKGADIWIDAKRVGTELVISTYQELHHHPTQLRLPTGWAVPWPFRANRSSVVALCKDSLQGREPSSVYGVGPDGQPLAAAEWVARYDYRPALKTFLERFNRLQRMRAVDLLPRQAIYEGQPLSKQEIGQELEQAVRWGKFFRAVTAYLDSLDPGQLIAVSKRCDPLAALLGPTLKQAQAWFTLEPAESGGWKVWFEGAPVPNRVKKAALQLFEEQVQEAQQIAAQPAPAASPEDEAMAYFRSIGCPAHYTSRQTLAWVVQSLVAEGLTDEQICTHGWALRSDLLAELKRVELPHKLDR